MGVTRKLITKNMYFIYILIFFFFLPFLNLLIVAYVMKCLRFCDINKIFGDLQKRSFLLTHLTTLIN